jgi:hypothetical protein
VYVSTDGGEEWFFLGGGLPTTPVHDIAVQSRDKELVIGTHGRSAFVLDIAPIQELTEKIAQKEAHFFKPRPGRLPQRRDYPRDWILETRVKVRVHFYLKKDGPVGIEISDEEGAVVKKAELQAVRGVNEFVWDLVRRDDDRMILGLDRGKEMVKPGEYTLAIQAGKIRLEGKIRVRGPDQEGE